MSYSDRAERLMKKFIADDNKKPNKAAGGGEQVSFSLNSIIYFDHTFKETININTLLVTGPTFCVF